MPLLPRFYRSAESELTLDTGVNLGFQTFSVDTTAGGTALTVPTGAKQVFITAESQAIRFRDDGTAPTTSVGHKVAADGSCMYPYDPTNIKVISTTGTATVFASYFG